MLDVPPESIDLHRFEQAVDQGREHLRAGQLPEARERLAQAVDLSAERPFGALADELHLDQVIAAIDQRRAEAAELLAEARLALGEHDTIGPDLTALIAAYPYRETLRVQLATALYRSGDQVAALRSIADARRTLADDIGLDPGPELQALEAGDPRPRPVAGLDPAVRPRRRTGRPSRPPTAAARREPILRSSAGTGSSRS